MPAVASAYPLGRARLLVFVLGIIVPGVIVRVGPNFAVIVPGVIVRVGPHLAVGVDEIPPAKFFGVTAAPRVWPVRWG